MNVDLWAGSCLTTMIRWLLIMYLKMVLITKWKTIKTKLFQVTCFFVTTIFKREILLWKYTSLSSLINKRHSTFYSKSGQNYSKGTCCLLWPYATNIGAPKMHVGLMQLFMNITFLEYQSKCYFQVHKCIVLTYIAEALSHFST